MKKGIIKIRVGDKWNVSKTWLITRYACGHYHINQAIDGHKLYKRFARIRKKHLIQIFEKE